MASSDSTHPAATISTREGPELGRTDLSQFVSKPIPSDYPLIDSDPHFSRVVRYARASDWLQGGIVAALVPAGMYAFEKAAPAAVSKQHLTSILRLNGIIGLTGGFLLAYSNSCARFYGWRENRREIDMDMREMVDRVKKGEPLYGKSTLTEYMQGVAARQTRYTAVWMHAIPWFNFVNHPHHGVDTAKYYRQAELELEAGK